MPLLVVVGPTASGKSALVHRLATETDAVVVSVDSMQVYRGMDIGTAKPTATEQAVVEYSMIDICEPEDLFTAADYQRQARVDVDRFQAETKPVIVAGGSGLHMRALVDPMTFPPHDSKVRAEVRAMTSGAARQALLEADPQAGDTVDLANPRRVERALEIFRLTGQTPFERAGAPDARRLASYEPLIPFVGIGVDPEEQLEGRVRRRFDAMTEAGLLDEVARVGPRLGPTARQAVGYKELLPVLAGKESLEAGKEAAVRASLALAKRQRTFFRRDPRITWLAWEPHPDDRYAAFRSEVDRLVPWTS